VKIEYSACRKCLVGFDVKGVCAAKVEMRPRHDSGAGIFHRLLARISVRQEMLAPDSDCFLRTRSRTSRKRCCQACGQRFISPLSCLTVVNAGCFGVGFV
jgi:hypothetical protein